MKHTNSKWLSRCSLVGAIFLGFMYMPMLLTLSNDNFSGQPLSDFPLNESNAGGGIKVRRNSSRHNATIQRAEESASLDYFACCGAGHRLSKLVDANFLAKRHLNFGLRVFFGFCGLQEVYSYFFGPQPLTELQSVRYEPLKMKVPNEVPGFMTLSRKGPNTTCPCPEEKWKYDKFFYEGLRNRFRAKALVDHFVHHQLQLDNHTVIGMHVRAGNGEEGDFKRKKRSISDPKWAESMAKLLVEMAKDWKIPPVLFLATDTESMVATFRQLLQDKIPVISATQARPQQGEGVLFGENFHSLGEEQRCLDGWQAAFSDMMILSHADVVVSARPSSFTQSLPMTLVLSTPQATRKVPMSYCEANPSATAVQCYDTLQDWCCNGTSSFSLKGIQKYEYIKVPIKNLTSSDVVKEIKPRPNVTGKCVPTPDDPIRRCLPYLMPDKDHVEAEGYVDYSEEYDDDDDDEESDDGDDNENDNNDGAKGDGRN